MGLVSILVVASMPVLKVLLLGALGGLLATPHMGILPQDARKHLNKLVFAVFTPALVFCNLVQAVTPANIIAWWYLPVNVIITFLIGGVLGLLVVKIFKPESNLERLTIACCSAGGSILCWRDSCVQTNSYRTRRSSSICSRFTGYFRECHVTLDDPPAWWKSLTRYYHSAFRCWRGGISDFTLVLSCLSGDDHVLDNGLYLASILKRWSLKKQTHAHTKKKQQQSHGL